MSKHPIESHSIQHLPYTTGPDTNKRIALHADVSIPDFGLVHFVLVHFSYDRRQQCGNALDVMRSDQSKNFVEILIYLLFVPLLMPLLIV